MAELSNLVRNLPRGSFDEIFGLVFTPDTTIPIIIISKAYLPPVQLQVSRTTRHNFAKLYYGSSAGFNFTSTPKGNSLLTTWLKSLPNSHRQMIERLDILSNDRNLASHVVVSRSSVAIVTSSSRPLS